LFESGTTSCFPISFSPVEALLSFAVIFFFSSKMKSLASLVLLLAVGVAAVRAENGVVDVHTGNANEYADEILKNLRVAMINTGLDPLMLPIKSLEFSKKVLGMELRGSAKVYDGYLKGLSTIHRTGLASMTQGANGTRIRATVGVNDLAGSYKASAKFMNIGPSFGVKIRMQAVGFTFEVEKPLAKDARPTLLNFAIVDLGAIETEIDGDLNILNFILNKFNNFVISIVKDVVALALGPPMKIILQEILNTVDLPDLTPQ